MHYVMCLECMQRLRAGWGAEILKDVLKPVDQVWMTERFRIAALARYRRLSGACDDQLPFGQQQKGASPDAGVS